MRQKSIFVRVANLLEAFDRALGRTYRELRARRALRYIVPLLLVAIPTGLKEWSDYSPALRRFVSDHVFVQILLTLLPALAVVFLNWLQDRFQGLNWYHFSGFLTSIEHLCGNRVERLQRLLKKTVPETVLSAFRGNQKKRERDAIAAYAKHIWNPENSLEEIVYQITLLFALIGNVREKENTTIEASLARLGTAGKVTFEAWAPDGMKPEGEPSDYGGPCGGLRRCRESKRILVVQDILAELKKPDETRRFDDPHNRFRSDTPNGTERNGSLICYVVLDDKGPGDAYILSLLAVGEPDIFRDNADDRSRYESLLKVFAKLIQAELLHRRIQEIVK